ncbi:hypothetical protein ACFOGJ_21095 [Marinibaculum pumilum]|uniref:RING-type E3 ubiquitin transferase n=1 Tax=Marinibaculum pumilum TaxID=1766165 RepID=A0ABV7L5D9_9PROT
MSGAQGGPQAGTAGAGRPHGGRRPDHGNRRRFRWLLTAALFLIPAILGLFFAYALLGLFVLGGLWGARAALRQAREIADTPTSKIRSAAQGHVEIVARGSAVDQDGAAIRAPLSDSPCCYWKLEAQRRVKRPKGRSEWRTQASARMPPDLLPLSDGTATCWVAIAEAEVHAGEGTTRAADDAERQAVAHLFPAAQQRLLSRDGAWRLVETRLPADRDLYAMGRFTSYRSNEQPFDDSWAHRLAGMDERAPAVLRNLAQIALDRSAEARAAATARWWQEMRRLEGIGPDAPLGGTAMAHVLSADWRSGRNRPLVVSDRPERRLIRHYRLMAAACLAIALAVAAVLAVILAQQHPETVQALLARFGLPPQPKE